MELSVYVGGIFQDKRIVTHRYRLGELLEHSSQLHIGSDVYGVSAFIGDVAGIAVSISLHVHYQFFNSALDDYSIQRLGQAKTVSHEILPSVVRIIHPINGDVVSINESEEEVLHLEPVPLDEIEALEKEEKENVCIGKGNDVQFATRRSNRRQQASVSVTSSRDLTVEPGKRLRKEKEEVDWRDIRIEDLDNEEEEEEEEEEVTVPPKRTQPVQPEPLPESVVDLSGNKVIFIDGR